MINHDVTAYNKKQEPGARATCELLAKEIDKALNGSKNKLYHSNPAWFLDGNPIVGYYVKADGRVNLLFWSGQSFKAQGLEKEGSFKAAEKKYATVDEVDTAELRAWLKESIAVQWNYKDIVRNKGKLDRL